MKTSVIIDNYNYEQFVCAAVDSVLNQTLQVDEIIIVDDGSTDNSRQLLQANYGSNETVKLIFKENKGQMSAINAGIEVSTGDVIFFLDADDLYMPDYIRTACSVYDENPDINYVFAALEYMGTDAEVLHQLYIKRYFNCLPKGRQRMIQIQSYILKYAVFHGDVQSAISIRKILAKQIFPIPEAITRWSKHYSDLIISNASSILGHQKYFIKEAHVKYRMHNNNHSLARRGENNEFPLDDDQILLRDLVSKYYVQKTNLLYLSNKTIIEKLTQELRTNIQLSKLDLVNIRSVLRETSASYLWQYAVFFKICLYHCTSIRTWPAFIKFFLRTFILKVKQCGVLLR